MHRHSPPTRAARRASTLLAVALGLATAGCPDNEAPGGAPTRLVASFAQGTTGFYYGAPTIVGDHVYVGTSHKLFRQPDAENRFFKLDLALRKIWEHDLGTSEVRGAATLDGAGNVYFVVEVGKTPGEAGTGALHLYSLAPDGTYRWSALVDPEAHFMGTSNPAVAVDGTVYVGGADGLHAFLPGGAESWHFTGTGRVMNAPIVDPGGNVYFAAMRLDVWEFSVVSVTASGALRWSTRLPPAINQTGLSSPAFSVDHSSIFVANGDSLCRLDTVTGEIAWQFRPPDISGEFRASPAVDDGDNVYIGSKGGPWGTLYAIRGDGSGLLWEREIGADLYGTPALGDDGTIYVGSEYIEGGFRLHALDLATGTPRWSSALDGDVTWSAPALAQGGTLYVGTMACDECTHGAVLAFDTDSTGLLPGAGWARFHGGNASTGRRE
jgi:outer membrane protein assembly factor BamB